MAFRGNPEHLKVLMEAIVKKATSVWNEFYIELLINEEWADLEKAYLEGAFLKNVTLGRANLEKANLLGADLEGAYLKEVNLRRANLVLTCLKRANLGGANLRGANLEEADLRWAHLKWAHLEKANLLGADLEGADLEGADLEKAYLGGAALKWADLNKAYLAGAYLKWANLEKINLEGANLAGANLTGANLSGANLAGANLVAVDLQKSNLEGAYLRGANLKGTNLEWACLIDAHLEGSNLTNTNLINVMFADMKGNSANLSNAILKNIQITKKENINPHSGFLELATAVGLDSVDFGDPHFLIQYLEDAFEYAHREDLSEKKKYPDFVTAVINKIKLLQRLYQNRPTQIIIQEIKKLTIDIIHELKKYPNKIYDIPPRIFEELVAEILASYGWEVHITQQTRDGGYDLFAITKDISGLSNSLIVECKRWSPDNKVGIDIVERLFWVKQKICASNALLATTSYFEKGVKNYKASRYDLELKDYEGILEWINEYHPNPDGKLYIKNHQLKLPGEE